MTEQTQNAPCCTPITNRGAAASAPIRVAPNSQRIGDCVDIPGGTALIGTDQSLIAEDGEGPLRRVKVKPFVIGATTVTHAQFAKFVAATDYVTEAEKFGWSFVFWSDVPASIGDTQAVEHIQWWRKVEGANWREVHGPGTGAQDDHPVTQVSWNDATAFARWAGGRLPSEAEWEHAARGGLGDVAYPWGDTAPTDAGPYDCNIWQGRFPDTNTAADGYGGTAPAQSFAPNGYGLYNMVGNVWEWTAQPFRVKSLKKDVRQRLTAMSGFKLLKGGSFLCHHSYCHRYRIAARSGNSPDSTTPHQGFRVVWDAAPRA
ncbi:formylglycine-generating enzyme family protein [uncultured Sulfitobacter sp.]|uniref:formylglycine-generating enzyme family protein n=1 Tax=uncultured Sulfitobacter sp. TaxID=191468 RepID=UPI002627982C|nr:formylglycine-generating enzyme family protein [uncultured Sulfitobacter sp.]